MTSQPEPREGQAGFSGVADGSVAAKYGSLSVPEGQVEVTCGRCGGRRLILHWIESVGGPTSKPTREGFGTSIIDRMIGELKGESTETGAPKVLHAKSLFGSQLGQRQFLREFFEPLQRSFPWPASETARGR
jgi:hypothetical protein